MKLELGGRVAIVTGGSKGIGKAIALEFAREGVDLALAARGAGQLQATVEEISAATGRKVIGVPTDTTSTGDVQNLVGRTIAEFGRIDILVNSAAMAGGQITGDLDEAQEKDLIEDLDTKVVGYFRTIKAVAPHMRARKWGRIISIGGLSARSSSIYGLRNAAVVHMSKTLSDELGADGITLNVIHPGLTVTEAVDARLDRQAAERGISREELERESAAGVAIRRLPRPQDLAWLATFLASPKSECVTGEVIAAGGGSQRSVHT
ncbi:MAG: SDR family oxidoreductase [Chloroflexota bacterium]|nr:SDR family oxidoreductase [Chloroflexota bacterium]